MVSVDSKEESPASNEIILNSPKKIKDFTRKNATDRIVPVLTVEIIGEEWSKDTAEEAAIAIESATGVEELRLILSDIHHFTKTRLSRLSDALSSLRRLRKFSLHLDRSKLTKAEIQEIGNMIESMMELDELHYSLCA